MLPAAETVLYAIGYDRHAAASRWEVQVEGLRAVLAALPPETGRLVYVSTTGVYGQTASGWVDEDSPCRPTRDAGRAVLAAEQVLWSHPLGSRAVVLRLAGIYGPGRVPLMADLLAGQPIVAGAEQWLNLIHAEDAVAAVLAAESQARPPRTYNISDGHPTPRQEFYRYLAELLRLPPPRFAEPSPEQAESSRAGQKKVSSARMLAELRVSLAYPSYREGLATMVAEAGQGNL